MKKNAACELLFYLHEFRMFLPISNALSLESRTYWKCVPMLRGASGLSSSDFVILPNHINRLSWLRAMTLPSNRLDSGE